jgi:hypothetical protein
MVNASSFTFHLKVCTPEAYTTTRNLLPEALRPALNVVGVSVFGNLVTSIAVAL